MEKPKKFSINLKIREQKTILQEDSAKILRGDKNDERSYEQEDKIA